MAGIHTSSSPRCTWPARPTEARAAPTAARVPSAVSTWSQQTVRTTVASTWAPFSTSEKRLVVVVVGEPSEHERRAVLGEDDPVPVDQLGLTHAFAIQKRAISAAHIDEAPHPLG